MNQSHVPSDNESFVALHREDKDKVDLNPYLVQAWRKGCMLVILELLNCRVTPSFWAPMQCTHWTQEKVVHSLIVVVSAAYSLDFFNLRVR